MSYYQPDTYPPAPERPPYQHPPGQHPAGYPQAGYPQAGYPPAGYPQPGFPSPAPPRRRSGLMIGLVAIAAVVVLAIGAVGVLFVIGVFVGDGARSPQAAVDTYLQAAKDRDWATAEDVVCSARQGDVQNLVRFSGQTDGATWKVTSDREINDDRHDVQVRLTLVVENFGASAQTALDITFEVIEERGWKVCNATGKPVT